MTLDILIANIKNFDGKVCFSDAADLVLTDYFMNLIPRGKTDLLTYTGLLSNVIVTFIICDDFLPLRALSHVREISFL